jgi:hypothetical protein
VLLPRGVSKGGKARGASPRFSPLWRGVEGPAEGPSRGGLGAGRPQVQDQSGVAIGQIPRKKASGRQRVCGGARGAPLPRGSVGGPPPGRGPKASGHRPDPKEEAVRQATCVRRGPRSSPPKGLCGRAAPRSGTEGVWPSARSQGISRQAGHVCAEGPTEGPSRGDLGAGRPLVGDQRGFGHRRDPKEKAAKKATCVRRGPRSSLPEGLPWRAARRSGTKVVWPSGRIEAVNLGSMKMGVWPSARFRVWVEGPAEGPSRWGLGVANDSFERCR